MTLNESECFLSRTKSVYLLKSNLFKYLGESDEVDISKFSEVTMKDIGLDVILKYSFEKNWNTGDFKLKGQNTENSGYSLMINGYAKAFIYNGENYYVGGFTIL